MRRIPIIHLGLFYSPHVRRSSLLSGPASPLAGQSGSVQGQPSLFFVPSGPPVRWSPALVCWSAGPLVRSCRHGPGTPDRTGSPTALGPDLTGSPTAPDPDRLALGPTAANRPAETAQLGQTTLRRQRQTPLPAPGQGDCT